MGTIKGACLWSFKHGPPRAGCLSLTSHNSSPVSRRGGFGGQPYYQFVIASVEYSAIGVSDLCATRPALPWCPFSPPPPVYSPNFTSSFAIPLPLFSLSSCPVVSAATRQICELCRLRRTNLEPAGYILVQSCSSIDYPYRRGGSTESLNILNTSRLRARLMSPGLGLSHKVLLPVEAHWSGLCFVR